ncbi:MAG: DUF4838 domain-containing protein [Clostridia bacterium]|nr:DUF4838 domain-containing protein [Clostridia bacterium]
MTDAIYIIDSKKQYHETISDYIIVYGANAFKSEQKAAWELCYYLERITGVKLPLVTDETALSRHEIVVGNTTRETQKTVNYDELGDDGYTIFEEDERLYLIGGEKRGTLYSVYEFLETYLGCRFYTETVEFIPSLAVVKIPFGLNETKIPQFQFRDVAWHDYYHDAISAKRHVNFRTWGPKISDEYGGTIRYVRGINGHSFLYLVPPEQYFDRHPEYFMMTEDGERIPDQLCLTNPDVLRIVIEQAVKWVEEDPEAEIISITQNDGHHVCHCPNCLAVDREEGNVFSGTMIRFVNAVADVLKERYPKLLIDTFAYQATQAAPKTKPRDNIVVRLCSISACVSHPFEIGCVSAGIPSHLDGSRNLFIEDVRAWSKICNKLMIYDYTTQFGNYAMTFPNFDTLCPNMNAYSKYHAVGNVSQGNYQSHSIEFGELRAYLLAKLMWEPSMSKAAYESHILDFLTGVYGSGGKYLREYLRLARKLTEKMHFHIYNDDAHLYTPSTIRTGNTLPPAALTAQMLIDNPTEIDWSRYVMWYEQSTHELVERGYPLFDCAIQAAETLQQKKRIAQLRLQLDYLQSFYLYEDLIGNAEPRLRRVLKEVLERDLPDISESRQAEIISQVLEIAHNKLSCEYERFNSNLHRSICDAGVTLIREGRQMCQCCGNFADRPWKWKTP